MTVIPASRTTSNSPAPLSTTNVSASSTSSSRNDSGMSRTDRAAQLLGQYLLRGWTMTSETCSSSDCGCILMRAPNQSTAICVLCQESSSQATAPSTPSTNVITPTQSTPPPPSRPVTAPRSSTSVPTTSTSPSFRRVIVPRSSTALFDTSIPPPLPCFRCHEPLIYDRYDHLECNYCGSYSSPYSMIQEKIYSLCWEMERVHDADKLFDIAKAVEKLVQVSNLMKAASSGFTATDNSRSS